MFEDLRERASAELEQEPLEPPSTLDRYLGMLTPQQRFLVAFMIFLNVLVLGCICLLATGRI